jgi:hypothetical protein
VVSAAGVADGKAVVVKADGKEVDKTKGAYPRFVALVHAGMSEDDAATAARAILTKPAEAAPGRPKERPVPVPKGIAASSPGGGSAKATVSAQHAGEDFKTRFGRLQKEAEADEARAAKGG